MSRARRRLDSLDRRLLPVAARRLRAFLDAAARARGELARAGRDAMARVSHLDDLAARGPLRLLRDVPQLALLLVAAVLVAGAVTAWSLAAQRQEPAGQAQAPAGRDAAPGPVRLGVPPGTAPDRHLDRSHAAVARLAQARPEAPHLALVHLTRYLPVADVPAALPGAEPVRVYLRAPGVEDAETLEVPLSGVAASEVLPALCAATARRKTEDADDRRRAAAGVGSGSAEERAQRADDVAAAERVAAEARAYAGECATAFAVVVQAPARELAALLSRPVVRGVEAAPAGARLTELVVTPLAPDAAGTSS